jgi:hypothetical protein
MNLLPYLPNAFSIYLTLTGGAAGSYVATAIKKWIDRGQDDGKGNITPSPLKGQETIVANVARDWVARYGFFTAFLSAIISILVICSNPVRYEAAVFGVLVLIFILSPMLWNIFKLDPDEFVTLSDWWFQWTPARWCKILLVIVNILLILEIAGKQHDLSLPQWFPVLR